MEEKNYSSRSQRRHKKLRMGRILAALVSFLALLLLAAGIYSWFSSRQASSPRENGAHQTSQASDSNQSVTEQEELEWVKSDEPVKIPILMYHAIHVMAPEEAANAGLIVDPETFESHLQALNEAGYLALTPAQAYKALTENVLPKGKKVVWLTFDDSMADFYSNAYPLLSKYGFTATNNVITSFVENENPGNFTPAQMKEMRDKGMTFEDHTVTHPDLSISDLASQEIEMKDSKAYLDKVLEQDTTTIVYPAGRYSQDTMDIAESLGYKMGLTTNEGLASKEDGMLSLNRIRINPTTTAQELLSRIAY